MSVRQDSLGLNIPDIQGPLIPGTALYQSLQTEILNADTLLTDQNLFINNLIANNIKITDTDILWSGGSVINLNDPVNDQDASTKNYIDTKVISSLTSVDIGSIQFNIDDNFSSSSNLIYSTTQLITTNISSTTTVCDSQISILDINIISTGTNILTFRLPSTNGFSGNLLSTNGSNPATLSWINGSVPGGISSQIQYNSGSNTFAGSSNLVFDDITNTLTSSVLVYTTYTPGSFTDVDTVFKAKFIDLTNPVNLNKITFKSNPTGSSYNLIFPATTGLVNQLLSTDGTGQLYWSDQAPIIPTSSIIYNKNNSYKGSTDFTLNSSTNDLYINNGLTQISEKNPSILSTIVLDSNINGLYISGSFAYIATENSLTICNIDSIIPYTVGILDLSGSKSVIVSNNIAYVVCETEINVIDISNKVSMIQVSTIGIVSSSYTNLQIYGPYLYVCGYNSLTFINVSNIYKPIIIDSVFVSSPENIFIQDNYCYTTSLNNIFSLSIFKIETSSIILQSTLSLNGTYDIYVNGIYAYISGTYFSIVDVSDKQNPYVVSTILPGTGTFTSELTNMFITDKYAYVCETDSDTLLVIDITNIIQPVIVARTTSINQISNIFIYGSRGYVCYEDNFSSLNIYGSELNSATIGNIFVNDLVVDLSTNIQGSVVSSSYITTDSITASSIIISESDTITVSELVSDLSIDINSYSGSITFTTCAILSNTYGPIITVNNVRTFSNSIIILTPVFFYSNGFPIASIYEMTEGQFKFQLFNIGSADITESMTVNFIIF